MKMRFKTKSRCGPVEKKKRLIYNYLKVVRNASKLIRQTRTEKLSETEKQHKKQVIYIKLKKKKKKKNSDHLMQDIKQKETEQIRERKPDLYAARTLVSKASITILHIWEMEECAEVTKWTN